MSFLRAVVRTVFGAVKSNETPDDLSTDGYQRLRVRTTGTKPDGSAADLPVASDGLSIPTTNAALLALLSKCAPPTKGVAITPNDNTDITASATKYLWVGGKGTLVVKFAGDSTTTSIVIAIDGTWVPGEFSRVMTATTATNIVALGG